MRVGPASEGSDCSAEPEALAGLDVLARLLEASPEVGCHMAWQGEDGALEATMAGLKVYGAAAAARAPLEEGGAGYQVTT